MFREVRKRVRRLSRPAAKVALAICLIPKLLVPTGYMPAALASGSPLMLCDAIGGIPAIGGAGAHTGADPRRSGDPAVSGHHQGHEQPAGPAPEEMSAGDHPVAAPDMPHGDDDASHDEWKRCSLGSLAAAAAVTSDWALPFSRNSHERISATTPVATDSLRLTGFRSRAPPVTHA